MSNCKPSQVRAKAPSPVNNISVSTGWLKGERLAGAGFGATFSVFSLLFGPGLAADRENSQEVVLTAKIKITGVIPAKAARISCFLPKEALTKKANLPGLTSTTGPSRRSETGPRWLSLLSSGISRREGWKLGSPTAELALRRALGSGTKPAVTVSSPERVNSSDSPSSSAISVRSSWEKPPKSSSSLLSFGCLKSPVSSSS